MTIAFKNSLYKIWKHFEVLFVSLCERHEWVEQPHKRDSFDFVFKKKDNILVRFEGLFVEQTQYTYGKLFEILEWLLRKDVFIKEKQG